MCVIFFSFGNKQYPLIVAANRDEYLHRPTARAHFWKIAPHVLAGVDEGHFKVTRASEDETFDTDDSEYLTGITRTGRFSFITNFREPPKDWKKDALSRGFLVRDFLLGDQHGEAPLTPEAYTKRVCEKQHLYNGFNLVVGTIRMSGRSVEADVWYCGNRGEWQGRTHGKKLSPNVVYGLSNGVLDIDEARMWPKVKTGRKLFMRALEKAPKTHDLVAHLLALLRNKTEYADDELPPDMYDMDLERRLCPICIDRERHYNGVYGTRTHTVIVADAHGEVAFLEEDRYVAKEVVSAAGEERVDDDAPGAKVMGTGDGRGYHFEEGQYREEFLFALEDPTSLHRRHGHSPA
ncbi:hypothetical protein HK102_002829 [Quaeritorhiza haematococci]|nr:hypothetical protein HK102_002829 [Quaeritorhiza haematococci]